jgi:glycerol-3-phosphate O-acyltransferase/dihydroxyacetone phosphate acyltransferase
VAAVSFRFKFFRGVIRSILDLYYRSIETHGRAFIPANGRTLFIANHQAGLLDGLLILAQTDQPVRLLIKHTLWKTGLIAFFANGLGMIPVFRKKDLGETPEVKDTGLDRHKITFDKVAETLAKGENVLIFPEGISHDKPHLMRLRSGAARMILSTEATSDFRMGVRWCPVSLDLEEKDRPGMRALLHFHPSRSVEKYRKLYNQNPEQAVSDLVKEMQDVLSEITLNFSSWGERLFIERLCQFWLCRNPKGALLDRHNLLLKWKRILENRIKDDEEDWEALQLKVVRLSHSLELASLRPEEVLKPTTESRRRALAKIMPKLLVYGPLMIFGLFFWAIPREGVKWVQIVGAKSNRDVVATYQILAGLVFFPVWLALIGALGMIFLTPAAGIGLALLGLASGLALLVSARRFRIEWRTVVNMYRYGALQALIEDATLDLRDIWHLAAKLWNRALERQAALEQHAGTV